MSEKKTRDRLTKVQIKRDLALKFGCTQEKAWEIWETVSEYIIENLKKGERVSLPVNGSSGVTLKAHIVPERMMTGVRNMSLGKSSRICVRTSKEVKKEILDGLRDSDSNK